MPPVIYLDEAAEDITNARADYEAKVGGLGDRFLESVRRATLLIESNPFIYGEVDAGIRACPTKRFPFVIYYRAKPSEIVVIAVRHGRDDPAIWQGRG